MRAILVVLSALIFVLFGGCSALEEKFGLSYDLPAVDSRWVERTPPTIPRDAAEDLAVQSAAGLMTLQRIKGSAYYEGQEDSFTIIRHEKRTRGDGDYLISVKYRIRDGLVYGETIPHVVAILDPKKEEFARTVAFSAANGTTVPVIYEGRVFAVEKDPVYGNRCNIKVVEKDLEREYATYRIKTC